jgi:hypothetical protein
MLSKKNPDTTAVERAGSGRQSGSDSRVSPVWPRNAAMRPGRRRRLRTAAASRQATARRGDVRRCGSHPVHGLRANHAAAPGGRTPRKLRGIHARPRDWIAGRGLPLAARAKHAPVPENRISPPARRMSGPRRKSTDSPRAPYAWQADTHGMDLISSITPD